MSLLVLGTVAFDSIETPFGKAERIIGGAGTYICWSASQFYNNIKLVSVIGDDFPQAELDALAARGVDLSGVEKRIGEKSFYWAGKYHLDMNSRDTLVTELNVLADFQPKVPVEYKDSDVDNRFGPNLNVFIFRNGFQKYIVCPNWYDLDFF
jgi:hypothetical protein